MFKRRWKGRRKYYGNEKLNNKNKEEAFQKGKIKSVRERGQKSLTCIQKGVKIKKIKSTSYKKKQINKKNENKKTYE